MKNISSDKIIEKTLKIKICNISQEKDIFKKMMIESIGINVYNIKIRKLNISSSLNSYELSYRLQGKNMLQINNEAKKVCELLLNFCIKNGIICSNMHLINNSGSFVEARRWATCDYKYI